MRTPLRTLLSGALVVAAASLAVPTAGADTYAFCARTSAARAYIVGSVWADGGVDAQGTARFKTSSAAWADSLVAAAACAGEPVNVKTVSGVRYLQFPAITAEMVNQAGLPPALKYDGTPGYLETKSFLAGVVQSEGGRTNGLIVDDVHEEHIAAVQQMLDRVGVAWHRDAMKLYAERPNWADFAAYPFVVWNRVPGYQCEFWV